MFGLFRRIREKSESDATEALKQAEQIEREEGNANVQPIQSLAAQRLVTPQQYVSTRVAQRLKRDQGLTTDSDAENTRFAIKKLHHLRQQEQNQGHLPKCAPDGTVLVLPKQKRYIKTYSDSDEEAKLLSRDKLVDVPSARYPFSLHKGDTQVLRGDIPIVNNNNNTNTGNLHDEENIEEDKNKLEELTIQKSLKLTGKNINNRLKLRVFKLRTRTDKALYQHFVARVLKQRKLLQEKKQEERYDSFILHKQAKLQEIEDNLIAQLKQQEQQPEPFSQQLESQQPEVITERYDHENAEEEQDDENSNVVTRLEMDMPIDYQDMITQTTCHYCHYRPLHLFSLTTNQPMIFTSENGNNHFSTLESFVGPRQIEALCKGGQFIDNIEMVMLALKFNLFIATMNINNTENDDDDDNCVYLKTVHEILDYVKFCKNNGILLPPSSTTFPLSQDIIQRGYLNKKVVVQLNCDWFVITPRTINNNNNNGVINTKKIQESTQQQQFIPTFNGLHILVKDEYAQKLTTHIALFHAIYSSTTRNTTTTTTDANGKIQYPFSIEVYWNMGSCTCHVADNINNIQTFAKTKLEQQQVKEQEGDNEDSTDDDVVGDIVDLYGLKVEQYTYCVPHLISIKDFLLKKQQEQHTD